MTDEIAYLKAFSTISGMNSMLSDLSCNSYEDCTRIFGYIPSQMSGPPTFVYNLQIQKALNTQQVCHEVFDQKTDVG